MLTVCKDDWGQVAAVVIDMLERHEDVQGPEILDMTSDIESGDELMLVTFVPHEDSEAQQIADLFGGWVPQTLGFPIDMVMEAKEKRFGSAAIGYA